MRALAVDGAELPSDGSGVLAAGVKVRLQPVPSDDAKEDIGGGRLEALSFSFFATDGDVSSLRSADETTTGEPVDSSIDYTAPHTTGPLQLWVVVRDGRGGVAGSRAPSRYSDGQPSATGFRVAALTCGCRRASLDSHAIG